MGKQKANEKKREDRVKQRERERERERERGTGKNEESCKLEWRRDGVGSVSDLTYQLEPDQLHATQRPIKQLFPKLFTWFVWRPSYLPSVSKHSPMTPNIAM